MVNFDHGELEYTIQIEASNMDGTIWQALHPAETGWATSAEDAARATAQNQNIADGTNWRIVVWDGPDADTSIEPAYVYEPSNA